MITETELNVVTAFPRQAKAVEFSKHQSQPPSQQAQ